MGCLIQYVFEGARFVWAVPSALLTCGWDRLGS